MMRSSRFLLIQDLTDPRSPDRADGLLSLHDTELLLVNVIV